MFQHKWNKSNGCGISFIVYSFTRYLNVTEEFELVRCPPKSWPLLKGKPKFSPIGFQQEVDKQWIFGHASSVVMVMSACQLVNHFGRNGEAGAQRTKGLKCKTWHIEMKLTKKPSEVSYTVSLKYDQREISENHKELMAGLLAVVLCTATDKGGHIEWTMQERW